MERSGKEVSRWVESEAEGHARNESCVRDESRTEVSAKVSIVCIARSRWEVEDIAIVTSASVEEV
jgi:hypothetical protein